MSDGEQLHATSVEIEGTGVLIRGAPGSGKSDLALRLIDGGARLVADDRVDVVAENGRLILSAPPAIAGLMEVRGLGILRLEAVAAVPLGLIVELVAPGEIERLAQATTRRLLGADVPCLELAPFEASAPAKLRLALAVARGEIERVE